MKTIVKTLLVLTLFAGLARAQYTFTLTTNLWFTNTITANSTNTFTGTNYFNVSLVREFTVAESFLGAGHGTGLIWKSYLGTVDGSNWIYPPAFVFTNYAQGTNAWAGYTNFDCTGLRYVKPYQWANTTTNDLTNVIQREVIKNYPKN